MKFLCKCGNLAVWDLMSSNKYYPYFCDGCVPRGCSCNDNFTSSHPDASFDGVNIGYDPPIGDVRIKWKESGKWCHVDEIGREYPCCEFSYSLEGFYVELDELESYHNGNIKFHIL